MRLLIVSYTFPPDGHVGAIRLYEFARLLPQHGIDTWVLTVQPEYLERCDASASWADIPAERIIRTAVLPSRRDRFVRLMKRLRDCTRMWRYKDSRLTSSPAVASGAERRSSLLADCFREWLTYPDWHAGWRYPALKAAEILMSRVRFSAVFSSIYPRTSALVGVTISKRYRLPHILDLRDPWILYGSDWAQWRCPLILWQQERLFAGCLQYSEVVIANTTVYGRMLRQCYPQYADKVTVIPNGIPCNFTTACVSPQRPERFIVSHFGTIRGARTARVFLQGFSDWWKQRTDEKGDKRVELWFYGETSEYLDGYARNLGIERIVRVHPPVPRNDATQLMSESSVLLLLAQKQPLQIPAKTYEYLASGKPILAMTEHDGATGSLLQNIPMCYIAESADEVGTIMDELWLRYIRGERLLCDRTGFIETLRYPKLVEQLAVLIEQAVGKQGEITP